LYDIIIIGAGPAGLSAAYAARNAGLNYLVIERGCIVHTIYQFPTGMTFYSTPELISLGDVPMIVQSQKPTREEALNYYLKFVETQHLNIHTYEEVRSVTGHDGDFTIQSISQTTGEQAYRTRKVIIATGAFDQASTLNIPGEELPKVHHYFKEAHPFFNRDVLVIGGKSSAVETALSLYRAGARVTMSYRRSKFTGIKYWVFPDLENRIKEGSITALMNSTTKEIRPAEVVLHVAGQDRTIPNDFVFCMIGHEPDVQFLNSVGVQVRPEDRRPIYNPDTFETDTQGIYIIGVITAGNVSSETFIENSRMHGPKVIEHIKSLIC
jgi:thioredoxin reductase (NADPH)